MPHYRCVAFYIVDLMELEELLTHSLVFKTKEFWSNRLVLRCSKVLLSK